MNIRIIPRLDIKGPNVVKGIHLEGLRVVGKPEHFARLYCEDGADELLYMDAVASLYGRNSLNDIVERTAGELFIPLTVGGGLRSVDDIRSVLRAGADKVAINTAAIRRPELVTEASRRFGSSTIVISIEAIRHRDGTYEAYTDCGRERTGRDPFGWAIEAVERGAGELMVTSIDREGTGKGFDLDLVRRISRAVPIPVIACGGAGTVEHVRAVIADASADAVSLASMLHYNYADRTDTGSGQFKVEGNTEFLLRGGGTPRLQRVNLAAMKRELNAHGIQCRAEQVPA